MAKSANYFISGVWFSHLGTSKYISNVLSHPVSDGNSFTIGVKRSKDEVINLLRIGSTIKTIKWNYNTAKWDIGAKVGYFTHGTVEYLRTVEDKTVTDNLDNLINYNGVI